MGSALDRIEGLIGTLPPEAQGPVQDALDRVSGRLTDVLGRLADVIGSLPGGTLPGGGGPGTPTGGLCDAIGGLGIPLPICP